MSKRALVTGCTGQDGSYLMEFLLEKGYEVYGLIRRLSTPNYERIEHILDRVTLIQGDLLDQSSLSLALDRAEPTEVYNLAAQSHVGTSFQQPVATTEYNGLGVLRLLEAIRVSGAPIRFYQASTSELFGNAKTFPQNEKTPFHPVSPYAIAKLHAHLSVGLYRDSLGMHASCGILFNHESPRRGLDFVTRKITDGVARIRCGLQDKVILGNLDAYRDWGFAGDYVEAMWLMLRQEEPGDYVIATGQTHSVAEFAMKACEIAGLPLPWHNYVDIDLTLTRPADVSCLVGDASKARRVLNWEPRISFSELVALMVQADIRRYERENKPVTHSVSGINHLHRLESVQTL